MSRFPGERRLSIGWHEASGGGRFCFVAFVAIGVPYPFGFAFPDHAARPGSGSLDPDPASALDEIHHLLLVRGLLVDGAFSDLSLSPNVSIRDSPRSQVGDASLEGQAVRGAWRCPPRPDSLVITPL